MKITEFKTQYPDLSPYFGLRKGKLYSGNVAIDGTPVDHYGPTYKGVGAPINGIGISSLFDAAFSVLGRRVFVEGPVQQRNPRSTAAALRWSFSAARGINDVVETRSRSSNMPVTEDAVCKYAPKGDASASDLNLNALAIAQIRYDDNLIIQHLESNSGNATFGSAGISLQYTPSNKYSTLIMDVLPIEGNTRFASLAYCVDTAPGTLGSVNNFRVFDKNGSTYNVVGDVPINCTGNSNTAVVGYAIPLDESLIERNEQGQAVAYHLVYNEQVAGTPTVPGKLLYKRIGLRPTFTIPSESVTLEDITVGTWPSRSSTQGGDICLRVEGRAFIYEHEGVRYLTVMYKMGRQAATAGYTLPYTVKRAVLTNGVAGPFETFTFTPPFSTWGPCLLLSPNKKTLWHYPYEGCSLVALRFTDTVTMDTSLVFAADPYINAVAADDDKLLLSTSNFRKYIARTGVVAPDVSMAFDKTSYSIGETAQLTVSTTSTTSIPLVVDVLGASVREHVVEVSSSTPATIQLTVTGQLQAALVDW